MADLYRKSSLDKLSNPEQLDRMIKISSPLSWLVLIAIFIGIGATVVWSVIGTLPTVATVSGIITSSENACAIYSDIAGVVDVYYKNVGDEVIAGDKIADIKLGDGSRKAILADKDGKVAVLSAEVGTMVLAGSEIVRITPGKIGSQLVVCYVPWVSAQGFEEGMKVRVYPESIDSQKYGHMEAEIVCVEEYAANVNSLAYVLGSNNLVAEQFVANGPVVSIVCKLKEDDSTKSGFYWSSEAGEKLTVSNGTIVSAKIVVEECAPITKLIGKFKDSMED